MGILDDAIREHLELKRQHGVPEEEVQRQEEEALGPPRRDVAQQHDDAEPAAGEPAIAEADGSPATPPVAAEGPEETAQGTALFDMEDPSGADPAGEAPKAVEETVVHETPVAEPPAAVEPTPVEPPPVEPPPVDPVLDEEEPVGEPGHDPDAGDEEPLAEDDEEAPAEDEEDLDLLEDTPDFLQETPEHDRLWFEQKPPRDFDFD
jgi:hypothetical protein